MKYSAQAIVVDREGNIYLEENEVIGALSFIGGKCESGENFIDTVIREVEEELGILFSSHRFLDEQEQPVREFWNERQGKYLLWKSHYFVLVLEKNEVTGIQENVKLKIVTLSELESFSDSEFPDKRKKEFLCEIKRALNFV